MRITVTNLFLSKRSERTDRVMHPYINSRNLWKNVILFIVVYLLLLNSGECLSSVNSGDEHSAPVFYFDYTMYKNYNQQKKTKIEFYYIVDLNSVGFKADKDSLDYDFSIKTGFTSLSENSIARIDTASYTNRTLVNNQSSLDNIIIMRAFDLYPDEYEFSVYLMDHINDQEQEYTGSIEVIDFSVDRLMISGIELATSIANDSSQSDFVKYAKKVVPNPLRMYTSAHPFVYFYYEIYNLDYSIDNDRMNKYTILKRVLDEENNIVYETKEETRDKAGTSSVIFDKILVTKIRDLNSSASTRKYKLIIEVRDVDSNEIISAAKEFYLSAAGDFPARKDASLKLSEERLAEIYEEIKPIAENGELDLFPELTHVGKISLIREFWKKRDPTPQTQMNEYMVDYYQRLQYVNEAFNEEGKRRGLKTDRGRIYLKYGPPTQRIRHTDETGYKPYIEWVYYKNSRRIFIFANLSGYGRYQLIHSTWPGELSDENWKKRLYIDPHTEEY